MRSLSGCAEMRYPAKCIISFNRKELKPWWGAWQPALLAGTALAVVGGLLMVWLVLETLYAVPVWLLAFFANRDLRLHEACRLAGAALMPGALLMSVAIVLSGISRVAFMMVGGTLSDRFSPRQLILAAGLFRAVLMIVITLTALLGQMNIVALYGFSFASGITDAIFVPARGSVMPLLVEKEMLEFTEEEETRENEESKEHTEAGEQDKPEGDS